MSKKLKPIKLSPNKYSFRGYIIKSYIGEHRQFISPYLFEVVEDTGL